MALGITDLKKGTIFQLDGIPYRVVEYAQKVMGRGGSIVNVKIKSLVDGRVLDKTFKGNENIEPADVVTKKVQYLYESGSMYHFMDEDTYEQFEVSADTVAGQEKYLREGDAVTALLFNSEIIAIELPKNIYLLVTHSEDAVKGDTSSSITKDAMTETGITVKVPAFIKTGDIISVDTESGAYRERKKD